MQKPRKLITHLLIMMAISALTIFGLEMASKVVLSVRPLPLTAQEFALTRPAPYASAEYWSPDFVAEMQRQRGIWQAVPGTRMIVPSDFNGVWFNVRDERRATTDQPDSAPTLYLFGGSTIYNNEVPDAYTAASILQRQIGNAYRVENMGSNSVTVAQQVERLQTLSLERGDLVVFVDGVNDVYQGVYIGDPDGWIVGDNRSRRTLTADIYETFGYLSLVRLFLTPRYIAPPHLSDPVALNTLIEETAARYAAQVRSAHDYAVAHNAQFIHVLQPNLFTRSQVTDYERGLISNPNLIPDGVPQAFTVAYPAMQEAVRNLDYNVDATHAFDESDESVFLDFCHVAHVGNELLANAVLVSTVQNTRVYYP